jgi:predicted dehydrogenase
MRFLIAGFGSIGRRHLRNLFALGERDVVLVRRGKSTLPTDELAGLPVETTLEAALAHRPDVVIVATPTALHMPIAIPAAEAGCTIFLEKPIAEDLSRVEELQSALQRGGGKVLVGFQFRFHPGLQQVRTWLQTGAIGRPLLANAEWGEYLPDWHPWEDYRQSYAARADLGGGVARTLCHPLDYLRWLLGEIRQAQVRAARLSDLEIDVEDWAEFSLLFSNGVRGRVQVNYVQRPPVHRLEIVGTHGSIRWDNSDGVAHCYRVEPAGPAGAWEQVAPPPGFERNDLFLAQTRHLLAVAQGQEQPLCTLEDGVRALELASLVTWRKDAQE